MKNSFQIYVQAWRDVFQHWRMWVLLYLLNVGFALFMIVPFRDYLQTHIGQSLVLDQVLATFDFNIIGDLLNNYGQNLTNLLPVVLGSYLLWNVFTMGGILETFAQKKFQFTDFWSASGLHFWTMFRLVLIFSILQSILLVAASFSWRMLAKDFSMDALQSEAQIIDALKWISIPYVFCATSIFLLHDYAKINSISRYKMRLGHSVLKSVRFVLRHFFSTYLLYIFQVLLAFGIYVFYKSIEMQLFATSTWKILLLLLLGQAFIFVRIGLRLVILSSANLLFEQKKLGFE